MIISIYLWSYHNPIDKGYLKTFQAATAMTSYLQQHNNWPHFLKQNETMRIRVDNTPQNIKIRKAVKKSDGQ